MTNYKPYKYIGKTQQLLYLIWVELGKLAAKGLSAGWGLAGNTGNSGSAFLGTIDSKDLTIKTANTTALTIDTSQNVGIGTSTPSAKLDVQGTVNSDVAFADTNIYGLTTGNNLLGYGLSGMSLTNKTTGYGVYQLNFTPFGGDISTAILGNPTDKNLLIDPTHALLKVPATEIRSDTIDLNASNGASRISQLADEYIFDGATIGGNTVGVDAVIGPNEVHNACIIQSNQVTGGVGNVACGIQFNRLWDNSQILGNDLSGDGTYIWDVIAGEACQVNGNTFGGLNAYIDNVNQHNSDTVNNNSLGGEGSFIASIRQFGQSNIVGNNLAEAGTGINGVIQMGSTIQDNNLNVAGVVLQDLCLFQSNLSKSRGINVKKVFLVNTNLDLNGHATDVEDINMFGGFTKLGPAGTDTLPTATLHVQGSMRYVDNSEGVGKVLTSDANGNASWQSGITGPTGPTGPIGPTGVTGPTGADGALNAWSLTGNGGTVDGTNFIGKTDNVPLNIRVNNQKAGRIDPNGPVFLGYQAGNSNVDHFGRLAHGL